MVITSLGARKNVNPALDIYIYIYIYNHLYIIYSPCSTHHHHNPDSLRCAFVLFAPMPFETKWTQKRQIYSAASLAKVYFCPRYFALVQFCHSLGTRARRGREASAWVQTSTRWCRVACRDVWNTTACNLLLKKWNINITWLFYVSIFISP